MKKILFFFLAGLAAFPAFAQRKGEPSNVIKMNPLALLVSRYSFAYELKLDNRTSAELEFAYMNWKTTSQSQNNTEAGFRISGFRIGPQYRYYVTHKTKPAPKGFFVAPFAEYSTYDISISQTDPTYGLGVAKVTTNLWGGGANFGNQWLVGDVLAIDLYGGVGFVMGGMSDATVTYTNPNAPRARIDLPSTIQSGFALNLGFAVGYAF